MRRGNDPVETSGGFVYRKGRYTPLGVIPGAAQVIVKGNNKRGKVVGEYIDMATGPDFPSASATERQRPAVTARESGDATTRRAWTRLFRLTMSPA